MEKIGLICLLLLSVVSCTKEDTIDPEFIGSGNSSDPYGLRYAEVAMGDDYRNQIFFDLGTNQAVNANIRSIWDLALDCSQPKVLLNSSKNGMRAAKSAQSWEETNALDGLDLSWDVPSHHVDSLAIGTSMGIYIIERGDDYSGEPLGMKKILLDYSSGEYHVRMADLDGSNEFQMDIPISEEYNFIHLNLNGTLEDVEPPKNNWDLAFTTYLYVFDPETEPFPYLVTGCLINSNEVEVAQIFDKDFESISVDDIDSYPFINAADAIGYNWKYFDFELGYITDESMNYIVKSSEGAYYKLHFTSFINSEGLKGYPNFEFQLIEE